MTRRLTLYFFFVLIAFSLIVGFLAAALGERNFQDQYQEILINRAKSIAQEIENRPDIFSQVDDQPEEIVEEPRNQMAMGQMTKGQMGMSRRGYMNRTMMENYIGFVDNIIKTNLWIVDYEDMTVQTRERTFPVVDLGPELGEVIQGAKSSPGSVSQSFGDYLGGQYITALVPIEREGAGFGLVLLHEKTTQASSFYSIFGKSFGYSVLIALLAVMILAFFFARRFILPLKSMAQTTEELIRGNYQVTTGVSQADEIGHLAENIDSLAHRLDEGEEKRRELDSLRKDFIANISHELKTPVTVMKASLEALKLGLVEDQNSYHQAIYAESVVLERLIQDLLDLTKLQNPSFPMEDMELDLIQVLADSARSLRPLAIERGVDIHLETEDCLEFRGDYIRLRQMFVIVIDNGVKYSQPGSRVEIIQTSSNGRWRVDVKNRGPVIKEEDLSKLFQSFYRLESQESGSGLGLAIAAEIAKRQGIEISARSSPEVTVFSFSGPLVLSQLNKRDIINPEE